MRELKRKIAIILSVSMILIGVMPAYAAVIPEEEFEEVVEVAEAEEIETEEVEEIEATEVVEEIAQEQISEDTETISEEEIVDEETSETDMLGEAPDDLFCFVAAGEATVSICCMNPMASYSDVKLKYATASNNGTFNDYKPYELVAGGEGEPIVLKNREKLSFIASDSNPYISRSNAQIKFFFQWRFESKRQNSLSFGK